MKLTKLGNQIKNMAEQFEAESWLPLEKIEALQFEKLERLAGYCEKQSPFFARRLKESRLTPSTLATSNGLKKLPLLTRRDLQTSMNEVYCKCPPKAHMPINETRTSGSTGEPVAVRRTAANHVTMLALTVLENIWHERDPLGRLCVIRASINKSFRHERWTVPISYVFDTGPSLGLPITEDISTLVERVAEFEPNHLWIYPNTLDAFREYCQSHAITLPSLQNIRSMCGNLSDSVKKNAQDLFHCRIVDTYSSAEFGNIAFECPLSGLLHIAAPNVIVEVLNETGESCQAGEIGRLAITDLNNFATPLVRYVIGDYAEAGPPCPCGRGWPTLAKIMGRERNLLRMPDGSRHWPHLGAIPYREFAPINQFQFIQHSFEEIEVRLVPERPVTNVEESNLRKLIQTQLGTAFNIAFRYYDSRLPLGAEGKFEEFICKIPT